MSKKSSTFARDLGKGRVEIVRHMVQNPVERAVLAAFAQHDGLRHPLAVPLLHRARNSAGNGPVLLLRGTAGTRRGGGTELRKHGTTEGRNDGKTDLRNEGAEEERDAVQAGEPRQSGDHRRGRTQGNPDHS